MPELIEDFIHTRKPTADRPLLGQTVLLVEDSRFASDAMRLLCLRSGARIRRADSLASAHRHLRTYRPSVAIVDPGLPDGSGLDLIRELSATTPRISVILAVSGDSALQDAAQASGADGFLEKPLRSLGAFREAILSRLPREDCPIGPRGIVEDQIVPDQLALRDDLDHAQTLLINADDANIISYSAQFVIGLAKMNSDDALEVSATRLLATPRDDIIDLRDELLTLIAARLEAAPVV